MRRYSFWLLTILASLLLLAMGVTALAQGGERVVITTPTEGQTLSGIVQITGVVEFPDFQKYEIFLRTSGTNLSHLATVYAPVVNGLLANLDTRAYADGTYQIVVRTVRSDSQYTDFPGPTVGIANGQGAPAPGGPEVQPSPLYPPLEGALLRIQNCSGKDLEFDYTSPQGFCSAEDYWIMAKMQDEILCTTVDAVVIGGCEYRGTAWGSGEPRARTYSFFAESGSIYEIVYAGGTDLFINPVPGDGPPGPGTTGLSGTAAQPGSSAAGSILPVSGEAPASYSITYIIAGSSLLLLLIAGGIVAIRRGKQVSS